MAVFIDIPSSVSPFKRDSQSQTISVNSLTGTSKTQDFNFAPNPNTLAMTLSVSLSGGYTGGASFKLVDENELEITLYSKGGSGTDSKQMTLLICDDRIVLDGLAKTTTGFNYKGALRFRASVYSATTASAFVSINSPQSTVIESVLE